MDRWVAEQIIELGTDATWVKGKGEIKNASLHFTIKFWWMIVRHSLSLIFAKNMLTLDRVFLIVSLIAVYDINFLKWISPEIH